MTFLSFSFLTYKKESWDWVTSFPGGFHRALGVISRAAVGVREVIRTKSEVQAYMDSEAPWRPDLHLGATT